MAEELASAVVLFEMVDEHVAVVTLNRPEKRNAVNGAVATALDAAVKRADADPAVRAVVLTSSNDRVFCAGADLAEVTAGRAAELSTPDGGFAGFVFQQRRKPWIAAAKGVVVAGGLELCLACDMIVAAEECQFGLPEVKRSLVAGAGGVTRLPRVIPQAIALEMIATGDPIDAARALAAGLVNKVVPLDRVLDEAIALARRVAVNAPLAVQEAVRIAKVAYGMSDGAGRTAAEDALNGLRGTHDFREGPLAFVEKRAPVWTGS